MKKVYIETSVISYLTSKPSKEIITLGHQKVTSQWWKNNKSHFNCFISNAVIQECEKGNKEYALKRLKICANLELARHSEESIKLANALVASKVVPSKAATDAIHIAISAVNKMDFLLTWNCKHIANALIQDRIEKVCNKLGYKKPALCTPAELLYLGE